MCSNTSGEQFIDCLAGASYSVNDIMTTTHDKDFLNFTSVFMNEWDAIVQSLRMKEEYMSHMYSLKLSLNKNLSYFIYFSDPKLQFIISSPHAFPRSKLTVKERTNVFSYLKLFL